MVDHFLKGIVFRKFPFKDRGIVAVVRNNIQAITPLIRINNHIGVDSGFKGLDIDMGNVSDGRLIDEPAFRITAGNVGYFLAGTKSNV